MEKFKKFLAALGGMLLFFVLIGGTICTQAILWQTAWYIAVMHLVLVVFAAEPAYLTFKRILEYIS